MNNEVGLKNGYIGIQGIAGIPYSIAAYRVQTLRWLLTAPAMIIVRAGLTALPCPSK